MVIVLFAVSALTFLIFNVLPNGDPAARMAGRTPTPEQIEQIRKEWGFNKPIYEQYVITMRKIFTGDLISYFTQLNVLDQIKQGLPRTLALAIGAALLWMLVALAFGFYGATRSGTLTGGAITLMALLGISMPAFWVGALLSHYLGFELDLFPDGGYVPFGENPFEWFYHLILPWITLSLLYIGIYSRVLRSNILDVSNEDYVRTARAKGLPEQRVMTRHVLRNALIPIVSLWGLDFAAVIGGGAILVETVFNLEGVGQYAANSIAQLDVPPVLALVMMLAFAIVIMSAIVDIIYAKLDPRIQVQ
jgi:peptide/nickel transport system permease protein